MRERDRERIEVDAGANQVAIETHTWLGGARALGFSHWLDPPNPPTSAGGYRTTRCRVASAYMIRAARNEW